ncbi:TPA: hypothetical protein ENS27_08395 [bacterium]|nr:hypothetical protein [bacterium]
MDYLYNILSAFRHLFNTQSYALFSAFILGIMFSNERKTVTGICKATDTKKYWSMIKFLSRSKWNSDALAINLIKLMQSIIKDWVYVYDETHAIKTGKSQFGLHFFPNHKYNLKNKNQSKYHWGHQFAALGLLSVSVSQTILFPVWVKMLIPGDAMLNSLAVLTTISNISSGLVIFDRGFNNRKVFKILLDYRHHLLCRAKSNAVFYFPVEHEQQKQTKRGRPRKYGKRLDISAMCFGQIDFLGQIAEIASAIVYSKMCPQQVRLVVRRTFSKTNTYKYFMVYTTDLDLSVEKIIFYYRLRWEQETAFRDSKQSFGFDDYQVKSETSINRFVQLSFVSMSIMQLFFNQSMSHNVDEVCQTLGIHWYKPSKLTRGLMQAYLRYLSFRELFSSLKVTLFDQTKIHKSLSKVA